jgi:glycosyltransferase involved in cell wall biosynthesis
MRILFVADGRSPITLNWLRHWQERGDDVFLASTFACTPPPGLAGFQLVPVAFSGTKPAPTSRQPARSRIWGAPTLRLRTGIRQWFGPLTISHAAPALRRFIVASQPELVHALRIPYEGMLAAEAIAPLKMPLALSVWGNDFTLHAPASPLMGHYTHWALEVANALHADCQRDLGLAQRWGFAPNKPTLVTPGNGGIRADWFGPGPNLQNAPIVINPRGFRAYVRNDTFFKAIPLVLAQRPETRFLCASMAGESQAEHWLKTLGISAAVDLLAPLPHQQMAELFRQASLVVSPSIHDGTPNSLLEAMACGCFPIAGDLESIREWITPDVNGYLVDAGNAPALAAAILRGLNDSALRQRAAIINAGLIAERADYQTNMQKVETFYASLI